MSDPKIVTVYKPNETTPSEREARASVAHTDGLSGALPQGVINSVLTGIRADFEADALRRFTRRLEAATELRKAAEALNRSETGLQRAIDELRHLPEILNEDRAQRTHQHAMNARRRSAVELSFDEQQEIEKLRRAKEKAEAQFQLLAAEDGIAYFQQAKELRYTHRNNALEAKQFAGEAERNEQERLAKGGRPAAAGDPEQAFLHQLHMHLEHAVTDGDHTKAQEIRETLAFLTRTTR